MHVDQTVFSVRNWPGMRSEYSWLPPDGSVTVTKPQQVGVSFSAHRRVEYELDGQGRYLDIQGGAIFTNGSQEVRWAEVSEPTEALEIYPDLDLLQAAIESPQPCVVEIEPVIAGRDATVLGLATALKRAHVHGHDLDAIHASMLTHLLMTHLTDHYCRPRRRMVHPSGRLDRTLVNRVAEFIEDNLRDSRLLLDDLAAEARLSTYHFARAFKSSTGVAPHKFVTMRRMERAKRLLLTSGMSVPEVAYAVGYLNISHFRRLFRHYTGFAPSDLRSR